MNIAFVTLLLTASMQLSHAGSLTVPEESSKLVALAPGLTIEFTRHDGFVIASGPNGQSLSYEDMFPFNDTSGPTALLEDINGDGVNDVLLATGIGYGGVNIFYTLLIWENDSWVEIADISNPEFFPAHQSITTSMRSGPYWTSERWDVSNEGKPFRRISQTATFAGFDVRRIYAPDGELQEEIIVAEAADLFDESETPLGKIGSDGASFKSPEPDGMAIALWLEPGTEVTLLAWDEPSGLVLIETADGIKGWIDPEDLAPD